VVADVGVVDFCIVFADRKKYTFIRKRTADDVLQATATAADMAMQDHMNTLLPLALNWGRFDLGGGGIGRRVYHKQSITR
jgi:hypothetical protein